MHRSQSVQASTLTGDKNSQPKKSLWGTLKSKKRSTEEPSKRRSVYGMSRTPIAENGSDLKSIHSASTREEPLQSPIDHAHSLDPGHEKYSASTRGDSPKNKSSIPKNLISQPRSQTRRTNLKNSNRFSRMFGEELLIPSDSTLVKIANDSLPEEIPLQNSSRSRKHHSTIFSKTAVPQDFLKTLQLIPSDEEESVSQKDQTSVQDPEDLSLLFEDYKLALEAYGNEDVNSSESDPESKIVSGMTTMDSFSSYTSLDDDFDSKLELKYLSNCILLNCGQKSPLNLDFRTGEISAKVGEIDFKIHHDSKNLFNDEDDDEDLRHLQRTSLHFT